MSGDDVMRIGGDLLVFFFKRKTAYEIKYGLVGSEMCIRDSVKGMQRGCARASIDFGFDCWQPKVRQAEPFFPAKLDCCSLAHGARPSGNVGATASTVPYTTLTLPTTSSV